jgi:hypothetical protein
MDSLYKYDDSKDFTWDSKFTIENPEYAKACGIVGAKAVEPTIEMRRYIPEANELVLERSQNKKHR